MDSQGASADVDLSKLSPKDKLELEKFIVNENQRAAIQSSIHDLTDICWKKCVTGTIRTGKLEKTEESCTQNCVERFMDTKFTILKHLEQIRNQA